MYTAKQFTVTDENGTVVEGATIDVFIAGTSSRATIYSDSTGTLLDNPFLSDAKGVARFYAAAGLYRIVVTHNGSSEEMPDVPIGSAQRYDVGEDDGELLTRAQAEALYAKKNNIQPVGTDVPGPTANDDETQGYSVGSMWLQTVSGGSPVLLYFYCLDASAGAAVWRGVSSS